ncbi:pyridoxamine 5'-phosphate oxidase family protein [Halorussus pelagicus]|uniref:pyridoxamine 5'-phosphate oxidase family protein n=1 Tax=Halorussus pelagicus TaxID=2505977 RepID=UPI000FFB37AB|nr:pyridoxamine 5'-phosphate oxidase family protein [Halorussus pelagicus]
MTDAGAVEMDAEERTEFLAHGGTGVLSFARGDESPFSLPVSYGYDETEGHFYFRLAFGPDAGKRDAVSEDASMTFVTYDDTDEGWRSVVAEGELEEISEESLDSSVGESMRQVEILLVDVFERTPRETTFRFFRLDPDEIAGRKEATGDY